MLSSVSLSVLLSSSKFSQKNVIALGLADCLEGCCMWHSFSANSFWFAFFSGEFIACSLATILSLEISSFGAFLEFNSFIEWHSVLSTPSELDITSIIADFRSLLEQSLVGFFEFWQIALFLWEISILLSEFWKIFSTFGVTASAIVSVGNLVKDFVMIAVALLFLLSDEVRFLRDGLTEGVIESTLISSFGVDTVSMLNSTWSVFDSHSMWSWFIKPGIVGESMVSSDEQANEASNDEFSNFSSHDVGKAFGDPFSFWLSSENCNYRQFNSFTLELLVWK